MDQAPDWATWETAGNLTPPTQMPTYDVPPGTDTVTPDTAAAARNWLYNKIVSPYTTGATSHGQPVQPEPAAPPAAPAAAPTAPPAAQPDVYSSATMFPASQPAAPAPTPAPAAPTPAPAPSDGIFDNSRHSPLNLRFAGQPGATNVNGFAAFPTEAEGIDAARQQMTLDASKYGTKTLRGLVTAWLGGTDPDPAKARLQAMQDKGNDPDAYVASVAKATGIDPDAPLDVTDRAVQDKLIPAMSVVENKGGGGASSAIAQAATTATPASASIPAPQQQGPQPFDIANFMRNAAGSLPYNPASLTMPRGTQLLAMAGGLLSGRSPSEALGRGFSAASQAQMADVANKRAVNAQMLQLANMGLLTNYRGTMAGLAAVRAANSVQRTENAANPTLQGALAGAKSGGAAQASVPIKENAADIDELYNEGADASIKQSQIGALKQLASSGQVASGPGLAQVKRSLSNYFGVDLGSDPTQTQITSAIASQIRGTSAFAKNMRNVREFNSIMEGLPNVDLQNPAAMQKLATGMGNLNNLRLQLYNDFRGLGAEGQAKLRGSQDEFQNWRANEIATWRKQLDANGGLYGDGSSTLAPTASSPTTTAQAGQQPPISSFWK